jgi:hypothetical protein
MNEIIQVDKRKILLVFIVALLVTSSINVVAIGVSPAKKILNFEPNQQAEVKQKIINNEHKDIRVSIYARGFLEPYINILTPRVALTKQQDSADFSYTVNFPSQFPKPGLHGAEIVVIELPDASVSDQDNVVLALGAVVSEMYVRVPYPKKYAEGKLVIETAGVDKPIRFVMPVHNYGTQQIFKMQGHIDILGPTNEKIGEVDTNTIGLEVRQEGKLEAKWADPELNPGKYVAKALIEYDRIAIEKPFTVGELAIEIVGLESPKFRLGAIAPIEIMVENNWNAKIAGVYGIMTVTNDKGIEFGKTKTITIDMDPLSRGSLTAYWDTRDIPSGFYDLHIELRYESKTTTKLIGANINLDSFKTDFSPVGRAIIGQPSQKRDTMLYILVLFLVAMNIGWFIYVKKNKKRNEKA